MAADSVNAHTLMEQCRAALVLSYPFFGTLAIYLKLVEKDCDEVPTAATNGRYFYYNPEWVKEVEQEYGMKALLGVVAHETLHAALGHIWRRETRDALLWNIACDYAVNDLLIASGLSLPSGSLHDMQYRDKSAEEIYADLQKKADKIKVTLVEQEWGEHDQWGNNGQPDGGDDEGDGAGATAGLQPINDSTAAEEWRMRVASAAQAARAQGCLPAGIERMVHDVVQPRVSWRTVLADFMRRARFEYRFNPPDRRFIHDDLYIPDYAGEGLMDIVVAVDTSGSISERELTDFMAECRAILDEGAIAMHIVACDASVHSWTTIEHGSDWHDSQFAGGGGTDFRPVFEGVDERGIQPAALVYLTDGYGPAPSEMPHYPVLWVLTPGGKTPASWGRVIEILD